MKLSATSVGICIGLAILGCGGTTSKAKVYPVRGTVRVNGQTEKGVIVMFNPVGGSTRLIAVTEADGTFQLSTHGKYDGAPPGEYKVTLAWPEYSPEGDPGPDRFKNKFGNTAQPVLTVTVGEQALTLEPIEVKP